MYKKKLQKSFNQQNLYIHNKFKREILKARERENVYIIKKIVKNFDEFVLFSAIRYNFASSINIKTVFLSVNNVFKFTFTNLINVNINLINVTNKLIIVNEIDYN